MLRLKSLFFLSICCITLLSACSIVRPGQVGIKTRLGRIKGDALPAGPYFYNPFITNVAKMSVKTVEAFTTLDLPTKEGLTIQAEIALLYSVNPDYAKEVYIKYGKNYQEVIVLTTFRSILRHISASYNARDLYSVQRRDIEKIIFDEITGELGPKGFLIEAILLKSITIPQQIFQAIEDRLKAEQAALQMDFIIQRQKRESERLKIEAEGISQYQQIVSSNLTELLIKWAGVQVLKDLVSSPNSKVIVTNGTSPLMITDK